MVLIYTHLGAGHADDRDRRQRPDVRRHLLAHDPVAGADFGDPDASQRGSFNAVSASLQQLSGGLGSVFAAAIIAQNPDGTLRHFDWLGYIVVATSILSLIMMYFVQKSVANQAGKRVV